MTHIDPPIFRYYYPVADKNGNAVSRYRMVNRQEFERLTGIDPLNNSSVGSPAYKAAQPDLYRALGIA
jgi:hypothetical protein